MYTALLLYATEETPLGQITTPDSKVCERYIAEYQEELKSENPGKKFVPILKLFDYFWTNLNSHAKVGHDQCIVVPYYIDRPDSWWVPIIIERAAYGSAYVLKVSEGNRLELTFRKILNQQK